MVGGRVEARGRARVRVRLESRGCCWGKGDFVAMVELTSAVEAGARVGVWAEGGSPYLHQTNT